MNINNPVAPSAEIVTLDVAAIAVRETYLRDRKEAIKSLVARGVSDEQFDIFLTLAAKYDLDPFAREIWCVDFGQGIQIFTGRDGFLKIARSQPDYLGLVCEVVCERDEFAMQPVNLEEPVMHRFDNSRNRGEIVGAYAIVYHARRRPTTFWATWEEFGQEKAAKGVSAWVKFPRQMMRKCAEGNALKRAFGLSGFSYQDEEERIECKRAEPKPVIDDYDPFARFTNPAPAPDSPPLTSGDRELEDGSPSAPPAPPEPEPTSDPRAGASRARFFAIARELGLPAHEGEAKALYYEVCAIVLGRTSNLASLRGLSEESWNRLADWIAGVERGAMREPSQFARLRELARGDATT